MFNVITNSKINWVGHSMTRTFFTNWEIRIVGLKGRKRPRTRLCPKCDHGGDENQKIRKSDSLLPLSAKTLHSGVEVKWTQEIRHS